MAETPAWVPLVGYALSGGLGIIGTLAGQWVTGKRSDRDGLRRDELAEQERRRLVYEDFLSGVWEAYDRAVVIRVVVSGKWPSASGDTLDDFFKTMGRLAGLLARIQLVGSAKASQAATDVEIFLSSEAVRNVDSDDPFDQKRLYELVDTFIRAARADIGAVGLSVAPTRVGRLGGLRM